MATILSSTPTPSPRPHPSLPLPSTAPHRLPNPRRRRDRPPIPLHSASPSNWSLSHRLQESLSLLDLMESQSIAPDPSLLCVLLNGCAAARDPISGRLVHHRATRSNLHSNPFVANALILMYSKCGLLADARKVFDEMPDRNVVSWTTAISMYHHAGLPVDALQLYRSMAENPSVRPNAFTYTIALNSCARIGDLETGITIHDDVVRDGCDGDEFVNVALIDMYAKCGRVSRAREVFDATSDPSIEACTAMVEGYSANGDGEEGIDLVRRALQSSLDPEIASKMGFASILRPCAIEMAYRQGQEIHAHVVKSEQKPGMKTILGLMDLYEKCDKVVYVYHLFNELVVRDVGLWSRMISGFVKNGLYLEALKVYVDMTCSGTGLNPSTVRLALEACIGLLGLEEGRQIHGVLIKAWHLLSKDSVVEGLAELYSICGEDKEAHKLTKHQRNPASPILRRNFMGESA